MRILSVIGSRPEAINMATVVRGLNGVDGIEHRIYATAQHREMLASVLDDLFDLRLRHDPDAMSPDCVAGLGYVGLPTAAILATNGIDVVGVDVEAARVEAVNASAAYIAEPNHGAMVGIDTRGLWSA